MTDAIELDAETIVIGHLQTVAELTELVPADNITGKLRRGSPAATGWNAGQPALRIRRIGGTPTEDETTWLRRYRLQFDAFAGTELEAFAIARAAEKHTRAMRGQTIAGAVFTQVGSDLPMDNRPDPDSDSERYLFGLVLYAHPRAT